MSFEEEWLDDEYIVDVDDEYIVDVDDNETEKENTPVNLNPTKPRTTKKQFETITAFLNEHLEPGMDKNTITSQWEILSAKLNDLGPPDRTVTEWRRIWSDHKQNLKRKRSNKESDIAYQKKMIRLDKASSSGSQADQNVAVVGLPEVSDQLSTIIENQNKALVNQGQSLVNQDLIIQEIRKSNKLLEEFVKKS